MASSGTRILICGGAAVDNIVKPFDVLQRGASRTSMPGSLTVSHGGVGRNVAEVLVKLGACPQLLSAVGNDGAGEQLLAASERLGIQVHTVTRLDGCRSATFTALLDGTGELVGAVADMSIFDEIRPEMIRKTFAGLLGVDLVVCDANLPAETLEQIVACCAKVSLPVWFEPVSVGKASRGRCTKPWHLMTPNWDELLTLLHRPAAPLPESGDGARLPDIVAEVLAEAADSRLSEYVLLTMGSRGAVLASSSSEHIGATKKASVSGIYDISMEKLLAGVDGAPVDIPNLTLLVEALPGVPGQPLWYRLLRPLENVRDSTGAGDALVAGTACAHARGWPLEQAVVSGLLCAHLTLFVSGAVAPFFDCDLLTRLQQQANFAPPVEARSRM